MTFLPVVARELRVAARGRFTHWFRFGFSGVLFLLALFMMGAMDSVPQHQLAGFVFYFISGLLFVYCVLAGVFHTAGCLCREKSEGTLGLLFLTDLRSYDIALGKLVANSLTACYAVLAALPILALPLLMGGITLGEFARFSLSLVLTLVWSLSLGLFISALVRETRVAVILMLALVALWILGPYLLALRMAVMGGGNPWPLGAWWAQVAPVTLLACASDLTFRMPAVAALFYQTAASLLGCSVLALAMTSWWIPRSWQEGTDTGRKPFGWASLRHWVQFGGPRRVRRVRQFLDANPTRWLGERDRWTVMMTWIGLAVLLVFWVYFYQALVHFFSGPGVFPPGMAVAFCFGFSYLMHFLLKVFVALEAARRGSQDVHAGSLELILVTPLPERGMVDGHLQAMYGQFRLPALLVCVTNVLLFYQVNVMNVLDAPGSFLVGTATIILGGMLLLILDMMAVVPMGLWMGAKHGKSGKAALVTLLSVFGPVFGFVLFCFFAVLGGGMDMGGLVVLVVLYVMAGLVTALLVRQKAFDGLRHCLRYVASGDWESMRAWQDNWSNPSSIPTAPGGGTSAKPFDDSSQSDLKEEKS